jgi:hypothetical protein
LRIIGNIVAHIVQHQSLLTKIGEKVRRLQSFETPVFQSEIVLLTGEGKISASEKRYAFRLFGAVTNAGWAWFSCSFRVVPLA